MMREQLSYVLLTPYSIAKSRTGGILSRLLSRTDLELVGAQIFTPDEAFVKEYADSLRTREPQDELTLIADYVEKNMGPSNGRRHRSLLLLFKGQEPCKKLFGTCGHIYTEQLEVDAISAETIRETYSDLIFSKENPSEVSYFEPAVLTARRQEDADLDLRRFSDFLEGQENIVQNIKYPDPSKIEQTLVIIKPDNWMRQSSRPGAIVEMFSRTGLRIVGIKIHRFSLAEALNFYAPVETALREKLAPRFGQQARELLENEFNFKLSEEAAQQLITGIGIERAKEEFTRIIEFMCGKRLNKTPAEETHIPGKIKCMILIYEGENAVSKIRDVLGPTDPLKAPDGTVRREFGSNVMVNTAHASDSRESYEREKNIVKIGENTLYSYIRDYL
jgi:nucleoside diphosphate kinase